jgi:transposase-like protein
MWNNAVAATASNPTIMPVPMLKCPNCGRQTSVFGASKFAKVDFGRARCEHCQQEFVIVNNIPMTEQEY